MTTSWKTVHTKLKETGIISQPAPSELTQSVMLRRNLESRAGSSDVTTNSNTPVYSAKHRPSIEHEWMPNYMFINRSDGL